MCVHLFFQSRRTWNVKLYDESNTREEYRVQGIPTGSEYFFAASSMFSQPFAPSFSTAGIPASEAS